MTTDVKTPCKVRILCFPQFLHVFYGILTFFYVTFDALQMCLIVTDVVVTITKFSLVISLVCNKDTDIEALAPASVFHHCFFLSCLVCISTCLSHFVVTFMGQL